MKTGFILDGDFINDPRVMNEALILGENGHTVYVLNRPEKKSPPFKEFTKNIFLVRFSIAKKLVNYLFALENFIPLYDFLWSVRIRNLIKTYSLEILHAHDLYMAKAAHLAAKSAGIPLILDLHENYPEAVKGYLWANRFPAKMIVRPGIWEKKERKYLSYANRIIVLSSEFRKMLMEKHNRSDPGIFVIYPNVPDIKKLLSYRINREIFPLKGRQVVFYFGVISRRRGIQTALEALEVIVKSNPMAHLLLIGPVDKAEKNKFRDMLNKETIRDHITWYPWKDISEFPSFAAISTVCISPILKNPQHESGVANKVFQYMLFGKPILVSDCAPQVEIVMKTGCGLIFRSGDAGDMASGLSGLLSDPLKCSEMGEKGRKAVLEEYNTEVQGGAILNAYASLKAGKS